MRLRILALQVLFASFMFLCWEVNPARLSWVQLLGGVINLIVLCLLMSLSSNLRRVR